MISSQTILDISRKQENKALSQFHFILFEKVLAFYFDFVEQSYE